MQGVEDGIYSLRASKTSLSDSIASYFSIFDPSQTGLIDPSNVGFIVRALKLNPTQAELANIISNTIEKEGKVSLHKLQDKLVPIIQENKMKKDTEATIKRAFENFTAKICMQSNFCYFCVSSYLEGEKRKMQRDKVIDQEKRGYIEPEKLAGLLSTLGEPFSNQEIEEMFSVAVNAEKGVILYEDFAKILAKG